MNRNTQTLVSALGTLKDHIRSEVSEEARKAFPSMERIAGLTYRDGDEGRFVADLFENPEMCAAPRFMERCFGAAAQERGSGERDHAVEAGAPEPPVPVTELDMEDRGDAR